jgi:hypothetical protein
MKKLKILLLCKGGFCRIGFGFLIPDMDTFQIARALWLEPVATVAQRPKRQGHNNTTAITKSTLHQFTNRASLKSVWKVVRVTSFKVSMCSIAGAVTSTKVERQECMTGTWYHFVSPQSTISISLLRVCIVSHHLIHPA